jgi:hypothetical protein
MAALDFLQKNSKFVIRTNRGLLLFAMITEVKRKNEIH